MTGYRNLGYRKLFTPDERSPPVDRGDQTAVAQHLHRTPDGAVGHAVILGEIPLAAQPRTGRQLTRGDPRGDVVGDTEGGGSHRAGALAAPGAGEPISKDSGSGGWGRHPPLPRTCAFLSVCRLVPT
jgi:hypothetical protein